MKQPETYRVQEIPEGCKNCKHSGKAGLYKQYLLCDFSKQIYEAIQVVPDGICDNYEKG